MKIKNLVDLWSLMHILWGVFGFVLFYGLAVWRGWAHPMVWGFSLAYACHTIYELKDIADSIPSLRATVRKIRNFLFGEQWAGKEGHDPIENSYGDQVCFWAGSMFAIWMVGRLSKRIGTKAATRAMSKVALGLFLSLVILYLVLQIIGPPDSIPDGAIEEEFPDAGWREVILFVLSCLGLALATALGFEMAK